MKRFTRVLSPLLYAFGTVRTTGYILRQNKGL